jgi:hypothetical protein
MMSSLVRTGWMVALLVLTGPPAFAQFSCPTNHDLQIQQALDDAAANGGGTVQLAAGLYETCQTLLIGTNVHLRGAGRGATIIRGSSIITGKTVAGAYLGATIGGVGVRNVSVSDLTVDHRTHARDANGIAFVPTGADYAGTVPSSVVINRVGVLGAGAHNYLIWNLKGQNVRIRDNWLDGGYPIPVTRSDGQAGIETFGGYDVIITGNTVQGVGGACINAGSAGVAESTTVGVSISQNYLFGCFVGVNHGTSGDNGSHDNYESRVAHNVIIYATQSGIDVFTAPGTTQRNLQISGNSIRVVGPGPLASGISVRTDGLASVDGISIMHNHIDTVTGDHGEGIRIVSTPNVRVLDNTVVGVAGSGIGAYSADDLEASRNRIERAGVYGLYVGPTSRRAIITDNVIADWGGGSPALLLEGISYAGVHRNFFRRTDQWRPSAIVEVSSCGVEASGNQALYPGPTANWSTAPCQ